MNQQALAAAITWALCENADGAGPGKCDPEHCVCGGDGRALAAILSKRFVFVDRANPSIPSGEEAGLVSRLRDLGNLAFETGILHDTDVALAAADLIETLSTRVQAAEHDVASAGALRLRMEAHKAGEREAIARAVAAEARIKAVEAERDEARGSLRDWREGDKEGVAAHMHAFYENWQVAESALAAAQQELARLRAERDELEQIRKANWDAMQKLGQRADELVTALEPFTGYAVSSIGMDLDGYVIKLAGNGQQPMFADFDRSRRALSEPELR